MNRGLFMFPRGRPSCQGMPWKLTPVIILCFVIQFQSKDRAVKATVVRVDLNPPTRADFATCKLTPELKEKFVDDHNKFRSNVTPSAADMEYLVGIYC